MWNDAVSYVREFVTWWLHLFGVSDPFFVNFGMAIIALFAFLTGAAIVFGIIGALFEAGRR